MQHGCALLECMHRGPKGPTVTLAIMHERRGAKSDAKHCIQDAETFLKNVRSAYEEDTLFKKIITEDEPYIVAAPPSKHLRTGCDIAP